MEVEKNVAKEQTKVVGQAAVGQAAAPPPAGTGASTSSVNDSADNTDQQRRDILLAELAALGFPQPTVAPAAPLGLDCQLSQERASEVTVKAAHDAQVKDNEAVILQLRQNIAAREQKIAEDAATEAQAGAATQSAAAHTATDAVAATASALVNTLPQVITAQAVTTTDDTPMLDQSLTPAGIDLATSAAPTVTTQPNLQSPQAQVPESASLAQDADTANAAALVLASSQAAADLLATTASANATAAAALEAAAELSHTTAPATAITHTAGLPVVPTLDPAALTAALQAAADHAGVSKPAAPLSQVAAALLRAQARHAVAVTVATAAPSRLTNIPRVSRTEADALVKACLITVQWTKPPAGIPTPWATQAIINILWQRGDPETSELPVPTRAVEVRKGGNSDDNVWINIHFILNILLPYAKEAGTEITEITSPFRMNEHNLLGTIMSNGLRYYFPTVKGRDDVFILWEAALDKGLTIADFEPVPVLIEPERSYVRSLRSTASTLWRNELGIPPNLHYPWSSSSPHHPPLPCISRRQAYTSLVPSDLTRSNLFVPTLWLKTHPTLPRSTSLLRLRCQGSPLPTHHHDSLSHPYLSYVDRRCPHYPLSPGDETHTFLSCPVLQPHFLTHFTSLDSLLCAHGLHVHLHTLTPRQRLSLILSSDPFPLLSDKPRTSWMRHITPLSVVFALDVHLVFPPLTPV